MRSLASASSCARSMLFASDRPRVVFCRPKPVNKIRRLRSISTERHGCRRRAAFDRTGPMRGASCRSIEPQETGRSIRKPGAGQRSGRRPCRTWADHPQARSRAPAQHTPVHPTEPSPTRASAEQPGAPAPARNTRASAEHLRQRGTPAPARNTCASAEQPAHPARHGSLRAGAPHGESGLERSQASGPSRFHEPTWPRSTPETWRMAN